MKQKNNMKAVKLIISILLIGGLIVGGYFLIDFLIAQDLISRLIPTTYNDYKGILIAFIGVIGVTLLLTVIFTKTTRKNEYKFSVKEIVIGVSTFLAIAILIYIQVYTQLELPKTTGNLIDSGIPAAAGTSNDWSVIRNDGILMGVFSIVSIISTVAASYASAQLAIGFASKLRSWVFSKVSRFSLEEYNKYGAASLITRNTNDIIQLQRFAYMFLRIILMAPMMMVLGIIQANAQSTELSFIFWYAMPILAVVIVIIALVAFPLFGRLQKLLDKVNLVFRENLIGVRVVRAFNRSEREKERFDEANVNHIDTAKKVFRLMTFIQPLMMIIMNLTVLAIVYFGANLLDQTIADNGGLMSYAMSLANGGNVFSVGDIFAYMQYAMTIMFSLIMVSMIFVMFPRAQASYKRVMQVIKEPIIIKDNPNAIELEEKAEGVIDFQDVTFKYPGAEMPVLNHLNFTAKPGQITAIIGSTGSGKSTLVKLLPRFYDITEGSILLDGKDIREYSQKSLRKQIGYVPQTAALFSGTVRDNLLLGDENASEEDMLEAIRIAQAEEFILSEEEGLDRDVSQSGTNLSGGQKQRLSIARAIVRKPSIYIFDDSFSALDFATDFKLRKELTPFIQQSTVFIVAQRVSTILHADQIVVLDEGNIVGIGTHQDLMKTSSVYQEIVQSQITVEEAA